jgi:FAD/FMN-containing dehydrogenase
MTKPVTASVLEQFQLVLGPRGVLLNAPDKAPYLKEWRDRWHGETKAVLRPASTEEVSRTLQIANTHEIAIVPQSGNTGLVGGQIARPGHDEIVLSLDRMTKITSVDPTDMSLICEAGATLKSVQDAAAKVDRLFPLSLASEGSCRIGGNLASNAGGVNVLAYGNARDLCLGLEVVLADGRVWNGIKTLRKDNTGYDLRNMFIGSEGTLGIITGAALKLFPQVKRYDTCFATIPSIAAGLSLLAMAQEMSGNRVVAFELLPEIGIQFAAKHMQARRPLPAGEWFVLFEFADASPDAMFGLMEKAFARGFVSDAVVAQSSAQRDQFWHVRETLSESQRFEGGSIKHDVAVPVSKLPQFIADASEAATRFIPGIRICCFGHMGDGNMHFNISQPIGMDKQAYLDQWEAMNEVVHDVVLKHGGSISAEHGIGVLKRDAMRKIKSPVELEMMRGLKRMLDPKGILSPGRVLPD